MIVNLFVFSVSLKGATTVLLQMVQRQKPFLSGILAICNEDNSTVQGFLVISDDVNIIDFNTRTFVMVGARAILQFD